MAAIVSGRGRSEATGTVLPLNGAGSGTDSRAAAGLETIIKEFERPSTSDVRRVGIQVNGEFLTKLFRFSSNCEDAFLHALPSRLAFWILSPFGGGWL